ncbi:MAG: Na/Pi cotransporter family protein [Halanaerobiaceae bacterium]|jgi:phosphate:Na+ symporter|nr:Na/Pi cotransporter family protein [Halanaerobiaceae bacterium]
MLVFFSGCLLFLGGLEACKWAIRNIINEKLKKIIISLDRHIILSIIIGIVITSIMQSSSAVSIILISLIESGAISFKSAFCIMMGANIGTTITLQIISLPVLNFYPHLIIIAVSIILLSRLFNNKKLFFAGVYIFFFAVVFAGLLLMSSVFKTQDKSGLIMDILKYSSNNIYLGIITGTITTAVIQSSSAVTGIIFSFALNRMINLETAVAVILGSNIGTCITAFLASLNAGIMSKRFAKSNFIFNIIGVITLLPLFTLFIKIIRLSSSHLPGQIANAHTFFNIYNVLVFLPFINTFICSIEND